MRNEEIVKFLLNLNSWKDHKNLRFDYLPTYIRDDKREEFFG